MRKSAFLLLLLLSLSSAKWVYSKLNVTMTWEITANNELSELDLEVFVPSNSSNQKVLSMKFSSPLELFDEEFGKAKFHFENLTNKTVIGNFLIEVDYVNRTRSDKGAGDKRYVDSSELVVINEDISSLAKNFSNFSFPKNIIGVLNWVYENVGYNVNYTDVTVSDITDVTMPSDWVMRNRVGVCDEFSHLMIAALRSQEIPARLVTGHVFANGVWIPHAWVEVYTPFGWVEADPTWNEFLNLNALRFRSGVGADQSEIIDKARGMAINETTIDLHTKVEIAILNKSSDPGISFSFEIPEEENLSKRQRIYIKVRNNNMAPVFSIGALIVPRDVGCDCNFSLFLNPNEEKNMRFVLELPDLYPNIKYTFPVLLFTDYGRREAEFVRAFAEFPETQRMEELPLRFKLFVAGFITAAITVVIVAIIKRW